MREEYSIDLHQAEPLLRQCGLTPNYKAEYTVGVFEDDELVATGSLWEDMIQMMAVSPEHQGEDLTGTVITHLIGKARERGRTNLHLFTKPEKAVMFRGLGFRQVAVARPYAALMEWGRPGIEEYCAQIREAAGAPAPLTAAMVMNCNPFTLGHRYLVETAASQCDKVVILAVQEDVSVFPFEDRIRLIREGTADLPNVVVLPGGRYAVSSLTFPSYFTKETQLAYAHCAIDAEIFKAHTAPTLGVTRRYVGTEPLSPVTAIYNQTLKQRLEPEIQVVELPRKEQEGQPISASRVRALLAQGDLEGVRPLVPPTTFAYLESEDARPVLEKLRRMGDQ
ncbi:[citrate (pro-3S)-lyase] ligase [Angelakisella massiliensis]|uniref:[citrate (pro-3S)-lyase] ligase n=1 Tax=Angelakisella massiliensis TaxID=1871018 RepID=UPI0008F82710|nr:[citrate (pro-3S)-lyase] ligase [Angelakisella massiliensis]